MCVRKYIINIRQLINLLPSFVISSLGFGPHTSSPDAIVVGSDRNVTPQSLCPRHREQVSHPCVVQHREMTSDSAELCETEVCLLHIQLTGTNVLLPKMHTPPEVDSGSLKSQQNSNKSRNLQETQSVVLCFPQMLSEIVCAMNGRN